MKNHEKRHKEISGIEGKRDRKKEPGNGGLKEDAERGSHHHFDADEDTTARISFLIDFSLTGGQIEGKIIHRLTNKQLEFIGLDQNTIIQFMKKYLSRLDKGVVNTADIEKPPLRYDQDEQKKGKDFPQNEIRTKSFRVIPAGAREESSILQHGQPFQLQWSFDPPQSLAVEGWPINYKVSICRKQLSSGHRELLGEMEGNIDCSEDLTATIHSEPLPAGTYRLEADAKFKLNSKKTDWSSSCRNSCLIHVT